MRSALQLIDVEKTNTHTRAHAATSEAYCTHLPRAEVAVGLGGRVAPLASETLPRPGVRISAGSKVVVSDAVQSSHVHTHIISIVRSTRKPPALAYSHTQPAHSHTQPCTLRARVVGNAAEGTARRFLIYDHAQFVPRFSAKSILLRVEKLAGGKQEE